MPNNILPELTALIITNKGAKFMSLTYTARTTGEVAKHSLRLGVNLTKLYEEDVAFLRNYVDTLRSGSIQHAAASAVLTSLEKSLREGLGNRDDYTNRETFVFADGFPGVSIRIKDGHDGKAKSGEVSILALSDGKTVIVPGTYKTVNSSELTLAKNEVRKLLKTDKIRRFCLKEVSRAALRGEVLEVEGQ